MSLNQSEIDFFAELQKNQEKAHAKPTDQMSIEKFRKAFSAMSQYLGEPAKIDFYDTTIPDPKK